MKLFLLCKRCPQQRDLLRRPYGRFAHLPQLLAQRGHEVTVALVSHGGQADEDMEAGGVRWISRDARRHGPFGIRRWLLSRAGRPDWIISASDIYYGIAAVWLARRLGACSAIDAYDNFESYMAWAKPLHWQWHRSLRHADLVTAAGPQLLDLLQRHRTGRGEIVPMAADPGFVPLDRRASRAMLGLEAQVPLVGYCGSFTKSRGSHVLLEAFGLVRQQVPGARLVLTGRYTPDLRGSEGIIALGMVPDERMPAVLTSLDVACVSLADTAFGRYSYPAKLYEAMACGVPVVASATAPAQWILGGASGHLAQVGDPEDLAAKVLRQLEAPNIAYPAPKAWSQVAQDLESALSRR